MTWLEIYLYLIGAALCWASMLEEMKRDHLTQWYHKALSVVLTIFWPLSVPVMLFLDGRDAWNQWRRR